MTVEVRFYTRPGCSLCEIALAVVRKTLRRHPIDVTIVNVEDTPELERRYGQDVPVVEVAAHGENLAFRHRLDADEFDQEIRRLCTK